MEWAQVKALVDGVMQSMSSARQSEVKAWEEEIIPCEHTLTLTQLSPDPIPASGRLPPLLSYPLYEPDILQWQDWRIATSAT
jgi:hypothetical protein